jgi:hypothetical protein
LVQAKDGAEKAENRFLWSRLRIGTKAFTAAYRAATIGSGRPESFSAPSKASNQSVKDFATQMVKDHVEDVAEFRKESRRLRT